MEPLYSKQAAKELAKMTRDEKQRIKTGVNAIPQGDIKPLRGTRASYRLRVGDRRIIFTYGDDGQIRVQKIGPRGDVYK